MVDNVSQATATDEIDEHAYDSDDHDSEDITILEEDGRSLALYTCHYSQICL